MRKINARNSSIELLRIVIMIFIVTMHVCTQGGIINSVTPFTSNYNWVWFIMVVCYCAVNCYALISGYVGIDTAFEYERICRLWVKVCFYTVIITILMKIVSPESVGFMDFIKSITPASSGQYWYFSAYFALFFLTPFLNVLINELDKKRLKLLIFTIVIVFSVIPTFRHTDPFLTGKGYSCIWLVCMYLLGAYLKKIEFFKNYSLKMMLILFGGSLILLFGSKIGIEFLVYRLSGVVAGGGYLLAYTSPIVIIEAVSLMGIFMKIHIKNDIVNNIIKKIGKTTFFVFIIHEHPLLKHKFIIDNFIQYSVYSSGKMVLFIVGTAITIFVICCAIDLLREGIFILLRVNLFEKFVVTSIQRKIKTAFEVFKQID
jgi:hypothetical protein